MSGIRFQVVAPVSVIHPEGEIKNYPKNGDRQNEQYISQRLGGGRSIEQNPDNCKYQDAYINQD
jgi:hypothetical protein